jgi:predicted glutamine amidotransferase
MCRWMAYRGAPLRTSELILHPQHSIIAQSLDSPLGAETVNGDGFGFGWYLEDSDDRRPGVFHSIEPAWHDRNLRELTQAVTSPLFFCHVRAAAGPPIQQTNCHPFRYQNWLFMHNGTISEFGRIKRELVMAVDPAVYPLIQGTTDSEVMFYLALTLGLRDDPVDAMRRAIELVETTGRSNGVAFPWQGTVAVTDGSTVWAFRYSTQGRTRSLFHSVDLTTLRELYPDVERLNLFSDDAHVVVSEPFNDLPGTFVEVPESTVAVLDASGYQHHGFSPSSTTL